MKGLTSIFALIISLIIVGIAFLIFSNSLIYNSVNNSKTKIYSKKVNSDINIYENYYGIPHIVAGNEDDLFFAIGYFQAKERLWQMDYFRRTAQGRLSEVFGESTVKYDKFFRSLGIKESTSKIYDSLSPLSKKMLTKYSEGVNCYIENNKDNLSFEFSALDFIPEKWQPVHSIMLGRLMAFELSLGFWIDNAMGEISKKVGFEKANELIPSYPLNAPHIIDDSNTVNLNKNIFTGHFKNNQNTYLQSFASYLREIREGMGLFATSVGSNAFAVKSFDSLKNRNNIIFANDPHLTVELPPRWIQMQITAGDFNVTGMTIPGIPLILSGRNDNIAFGITNIMVDDVDFYVETLDKTRNYYYSNDSTEKQKIKFKADTIKIKNGKEIQYYRRFTDKSEIISDHHLFNYNDALFKSNKNKANQNFYKQHAITFLWTGNFFSDEFFGLYHINKAKNLTEFQYGAKFWGSPGLNFTYCDKKGNLAMFPSALIPKRDFNCNPNFPNDANKKNNKWLGFVNNDSIPYSINPNRTFVASANNRISKNLKYHISDYWEPSSRIERIYELLGQNSGNFTLRDAQYVQNDYLSPYSKEILKIVLPVFEKYFYLLKNEEVRTLNYLKNWDYIMNSQSKEAAVFNMFMYRLIYNTFFDELGEDLYREYVFVTNIPTRIILELLLMNDSHWFDNVNSSEVETKEYIIFNSFRETLDLLEKEFGTNKVEKWRWGKLHKLSLNHIFSKNEFLKPSVTIEELETGGNNTTVSNTEWKYYEPFATKVAASMRFVCDLNDTVIYTSIPGGNSGDPMNPNYANQTQIWINGGYIKIPFSRKINEEFKLSVKILRDF